MLKDLKNSLLVKDFAFKKREGGRKLGEVRGNMVCLSVILSFEFIGGQTDGPTRQTSGHT